MEPCAHNGSRRPSAFRRAAAGRPSRLALTPLIDVTFQLLVFFLVAFQIRPAEGALPASLPCGDGPPPIRVKADLMVHAQGEHDESAVYVFRGLVTTDPAELAAALKQAAGHAPRALAVRIHPRGEVRWSFVVEAFNAAVRAKVTDVSFAQSR